MRILICGDYCPNNRIKTIIDSGNYDRIFADIKPVVSSVDYSIVNFETIVKRDADVPIPKCGPNLCCTEEAIKALKWIGLDCVTLANNHTLDYGGGALLHTISLLNSHGIDNVGAGKNLKDSSNILYKEIKGKTLAILNACEHEFSIAGNNGAGCNPLNPTQQYYSILEAKNRADYVLVIIHGGLENYQLPSPRMLETYRFFIDVGADAVVNHHQHCYSGYEVYKGKPIFYGLGNFCFDSFSEWKENTMWNEGFMLELNFQNNEIVFELVPYIQCGEEPMINIVRDKTPFKEKINELNAIIASPEEIENRIHRRFEETRFSTEWNFEPYRSSVLYNLFSRGKLPHFLTGNSPKKQALFNYINCETHRERVLYLLKNKK